MQSCLEILHITQPLAVFAADLPLLEADQQCRLELGNQVLGYLGEVNSRGLKQFGLRAATTILEMDLKVLAAAADLVPQQHPLSEYPAIARDLNLIVDESLQWAPLEATVRQAAGPLLESLEFQEVYRDPKKDGAAKKRMLFSITLRSSERTLTNEEADAIRNQVVAACGHQHRAVLLG